METGLPVVGCPGSRMRMRRGSRAARRQPRSAAGVGAPASRSPRPGRGWGCGGDPRIGKRKGNPLTKLTDFTIIWTRADETPKTDAPRKAVKRTVKK